jgi:shikimate kinase
MQIREPLYREIADFVAVTTRRRVAHVAGQIVDAYRLANASSRADATP